MSHNSAKQPRVYIHNVIDPIALDKARRQVFLEEINL